MWDEPVNILQKAFSINQEQSLGHAAIEKLQKKRLEKILKCAYRTPHYRNLMERESLSIADIVEDISLLPITRKDEVRQSPESLIQDGIPKESLSIYKTSGSTGTPMSIYVDREMFWHRVASNYQAEISFGRSPVELFAHITAMNRAMAVHPILKKLKLFPVMHLPIINGEEENLSALQKNNAKMIRSYPSALNILAKLNSIKKTPLKVKSILSGGEHLSEKSRKYIEESFSCPVFNRYGAIECPSLAKDCTEEKNLHITEGSYLVEIVDKKGKPVKSGTGEIVITHFFNKSMPFVRYSTGDLGCWGKECSCGRNSRVLKSLEGRESEMIVLPSGKTIPAFSLALLPLESVFAGVLNYQIVQEKEDLLVVRYVAMLGGITEKTKEEIKKIIDEVCLGEVKVEFEEANEIKPGKTGKRKNFVSKIKH